MRVCVRSARAARQDAPTEHVPKRSKKSKAKRERAEARRQYFAANPLSPAQKIEKAAESKARQDAAGGDMEYKLQKKARKAAERAAATVHGMSDYEAHPEDAALYDQANVHLQTRHRGVPSEYEI